MNIHTEPLKKLLRIVYICLSSYQYKLPAQFVRVQYSGYDSIIILSLDAD